MLHIVFEYRDDLSLGEWKEQECVVSSVEECKELYGLGTDCEYRIIKIEEIPKAKDPEPVIIKEKLDEILKQYNILAGPQYLALLNDLQLLREEVERNRDGKSSEVITEKWAEGLRAIVGFLYDSHLITTKQADGIRKLINDIGYRREEKP